MNNSSNKSSVGIIALIIGLVVVVAAGFYLYKTDSVDTTLVPIETATTTSAATPGSGQGASIVSPEDRIVVAYPAGGETLSIGKTYDVRWANYIGTEALTIALQPAGGSSKIVATNVSANATSYSWLVGSEVPGKYTIQVYPSGGRPYIGVSKEFTISGDSLVVVDAPTAGSRVKMNNPVLITGKAKSIFNEGEFGVTATYLLDDKKQGIAQAVATCDLTGNGCDWTSGNLVAFKATLNLSKSPVCSVQVEFYKTEAKDSTKTAAPVYTFPLWLYGNDNCK
jgi:hypothetical protein